MRNALKSRKFSALDYQEHNKPSLNFAFFKLLIDNGFPPMVTIDSDKRKESEDWIKIGSDGHLKHILNVVDYGEGLNPQTLCRTRYFLVWDSLSRKNILHKIPAENLIQHLLGIFKITGVTEIRPPEPNEIIRGPVPSTGAAH